MKWNIGHADPNVYNIPIYENPRPTSIPLFCSNFNTFIVEKKKKKKKTVTNRENRIIRSMERRGRETRRIKIPLILTDCDKFAYEKRNERTFATWTRRVRRAAPAATATPRTPRAPTWLPSDRPNTTAVFIWGWALSRSGSAPWSTRASSSANTSSSSRTPSATTSCSPSRRPPGWRSSSYRCILYFSTTRFVPMICSLRP